MAFRVVTDYQYFTPISQIKKDKNRLNTKRCARHLLAKLLKPSRFREFFFISVPKLVSHSLQKKSNLLPYLKRLRNFLG